MKTGKKYQHTEWGVLAGVALGAEAAEVARQGGNGPAPCPRACPIIPNFDQRRRIANF